MPMYSSILICPCRCPSLQSSSRYNMYHLWKCRKLHTHIFVIMIMSLCTDMPWYASNPLSSEQNTWRSTQFFMAAGKVGPWAPDPGLQHLHGFCDPSERRAKQPTPWNGWNGWWIQMMEKMMLKWWIMDLKWRIWILNSGYWMIVDLDGGWICWRMDYVNICQPEYSSAGLSGEDQDWVAHFIIQFLNGY